MNLFEFILKAFLLSLYLERYAALKYIYGNFKNTDLKAPFGQISLIKSVKANSNLRCLSECDREMHCLSATFNSQQVCNLYNNTITNQTQETDTASGTILNYKKFSTINESCFRTECDHRKLLECSGMMCRCNPTAVGNTWCVEQLRCAKWPQIVPNAACSWNCECDNVFGLVCANGSCQCDTLSINNTWCGEQSTCTRPPRTYVSICTWNCECNNTLGLVCANNLCQCDAFSINNTWCVEQSTCARPPRTYSSVCLWNCECDSTVGLICSGSSCICDSTKLQNTWCSAQSRCARSPGSFNAQCTWNCECDSSLGLICSGSNCVCDTSKLENTWCSAQSRCARSPRSLNAQCTWNCECDSSLGLICDGTNCQCNPSNILASTWCAEQSRCARSPGSYTTDCTWNCECDASVSLVCINSVCNCKNSSFYWISSKCDWIPITTYIIGDAQTGWGTWGAEQQCANRGRGIGYQLIVEDSCGSCDDTALNGILVTCNDSSIISSSVGKWGIAKNFQKCPAGSVLIGFSLRTEPYQGSAAGDDDSAANDLQMKCSDGTILSNSGGTSWGSFGSWFTCSIGHICGIKTLVEGDQGPNDDTTLNNVEFTCCFP